MLRSGCASMFPCNAVVNNHRTRAPDRQVGRHETRNVSGCQGVRVEVEAETYSDFTANDSDIYICESYEFEDPGPW